MTRYFSLFVSVCCLAVLVLAPLAALYLLVDLEQFAELAKEQVTLPIQWQTVTAAQWYGLWGLTFIYLVVGLIGLYFAWRAFSNFAKGELFNDRNSRDLRLFSIWMFVQALAKPLHFTLTSLLLSMNHEPGQRILSITLGGDEIKVIALAMILWVMSDLLVKGSALETENRQFI